MAAKKIKAVPVARYEAGQLVRVLYRSIEYVGAIQAMELRRGAITYAVKWPPEAIERDPALRGMQHVTEADVIGVVGAAPTRELSDDGFAARMAKHR